ncbi:MAG TPA: DUF2905 domain-containing protein [Candidatus Acidoferrales bacterium]|nr:DUF2905 domain-containing protein [Candidatus Acidoferrales bacterium]
MTSSLRDVGKLLIISGAILIAAGLALTLGARVPFRLGHFPGDISYHGRHGNFYFPVVICILLSVVISVILWVANHLRR